MKPEIQKHLSILEVEPDNAQELEGLRALVRGEASASPALSRVLEDARRLHRERGSFELVVALLDLELELTPDGSRRADLLYERGRILGDELLLEDQAVAAFNEVLRLRPDDAGASESLAHFALVRDNWEKIVKKYLEEAKGSSDRQLTTSLYLSVAENLFKYQPGSPDVEVYLRKSLEVEPRNRKASLHLERLLKQQARWPDLAALFEQRIETAATKEERVQAYLAAADLHRDRLNKPEVATEYHTKALGTDPANPRALDALVGVYEAQENWEALIHVYENALKSRPRGESELGTVVQIAMLYWRRLNKMDEAEEYFRRIRKVEPAHPSMLEFYRSFHEQRAEGTKLLAVLAQAHKAEDDPAKRLEIGIEMARVAEAGGSVEKAIDVWKSVLRADPSFGEAADALKRLYRRSEKWNALLELLKDEIEHLPATAIDAKVERYLDIVAIYRDHLNLDVMVINTYNNILQLAPNHAGALDALAAKYEAMGRWNDLIIVLGRKAEGCQEPKEKVTLLRRVAGLWLDRFANASQAVAPLEQILAVDPADREAIDRLKDIYTKRRQWRALLDLLRKEIKLVAAADRRARLVEMARLAAERLGDAREAIAAWNQLLEDDPGDAEALGALAVLYEREKRFPALCEILDRQRQAAVDPHAKLVLTERLGTIMAEKLDAAARAAEVWRDVIKLQPAHPKAMRVLRELYAQAGQFEELEALFAGSGSWEELVDTLHQVADRNDDPAVKLRLFGRIAQVCGEKLKAPERATKAYERILQLDPANLAAAKALVPIYRDGEKWARLLAVYEILLGHATGLEEQLALHADIRSLCEVRLGSKALAFQWCSRAYELDPEDATVKSELERLALEADAWDKLSAIYAARAGSVGDEEERIRLYRRLAQIASQRLNRRDDARLYYEEVLKSRPDDSEALGALEQLFVQGQAWADLLRIYRLRLEREAADTSAEALERRLDVLFRMAFIEEERLVDLDAAATTYRRIDELQPDNVRAMRALARLNQARSDWPELARILERELRQATNDDTRVDLNFQLGDLYEARLGQPAQALGFYRAALALDPLHRPSVTALERYLAPGTEARFDVAGLLVPFYERTEDWSKLAGALEIVLEGTTGATERVALLKRLGILYGRRLGNAKAAYETVGRVFDVTPDDAEVRAELVSAAEALDCHEDLVKRFTSALDRAQERSPLQRDLAWEVAQLADVHLRNPKDAQFYYALVLDIDPDHKGAFEALCRLYREGESPKELRALLLNRTEREGDAAVRRDLLYQVSELDEAVLDDPPHAVAAYEQILSIDPAQLRAYKALERLYTSSSQWRELDDLLTRELSATAEIGEQVQLKYRRADLHSTKLEDPVGAADLLEDVLAEAPTHEPARKLLERLLQQPDLKLRVARMLEPLYERDELWPKLVAVLQVQREQSTGPEQVRLIGRIAELQETRLGSRQLGFLTWREALKLDPSAEDVRRNFERLGTMLERWADLAAGWEEALRAADESDLALRAETCAKMAAIYEARLNDGARATVAWRTMLELDPTRLDTARPAAEALCRLYERAHAWSDLIGIVRRQVEWSDDPTARKQHLFRIATVQERELGDQTAAVGTWREVLDIDAAAPEALDALERLYTASGSWTDLIEILRRRLDLTSATADRRGLHGRIAEIYEDRLKDDEAAVSAYRAILDEIPADVAALDALARLLQRQERWPDLEEVLERRLAAAWAADEKAELLGRLGALAEHKLGRPDQALERYRDLLQLHPDHDGARAGLERMLEDEQLRLRAAEVLEPIYQARADFARLAALHELWADASPDAGERIRRLRQVAELCEEQLKDPDRAFAAYARAVRDALGDAELVPLLNSLQRLTVQRQKFPELVGLYREIGADVLDQTVQQRIYLTVAQLARTQLHDLEMSRDYFRRVLDQAPDHEGALDALEGLYLEAGDHERLLEILHRRAELAEQDLELRRAYLGRAAELCQAQLGRPIEAITIYEQILELLPGDREAAESLEHLYADGARWADLAALLERRLGFAANASEAVVLSFRLGELWEQKLGDVDHAIDHYRATLSGEPGHAGAIAALERFLSEPSQQLEAAEVLEPVYAARQNWPQLIKISEIRLQAADDPAQRLALTRRVARLCEEQLEDLDAAFRWYGKLFREDPQDRSTRDQLIRLAGILDTWPDLAAVLQDYLDETYEESAATMEVCKTLAHVYDDRLADVTKARACYERILKANPEDVGTFAALEASLTRAQRWHDLLDVYRGFIDTALDPDLRKRLLFKVCHVWEDALQNRGEAISGYRAVLDVDAENRMAIEALDRLLQAEERWHDLAELVLRQVEQSRDPDQTVALRFRLGGIYEKRLLDLTSAIDAYEEVLKSKVNHLEAIASLERLRAEREHTFRIDEILEPVYKQLDDWAHLVPIYESELDFIDEKVRRIDILTEVARLHELRGGDLPKAFDAAARAYLEDVAQEDRIGELERLTGLLGRPAALVEVLDRGAEATYDYDLRTRLWAKTAQVHELLLRDGEQAVAAWRKVLGVHDDDTAALLALERLLGEQRRFADLVPVLEHRAELASDPDERKQLYSRVAVVEERELDDRAKAITTWRHVMSLDDTDTAALDALERLLRLDEAWRELTRIYQRKLELASDAPTRIGVFFLLAEVHETKLGDAYEAISAYKSVLLETGHEAEPEALAALDRLFQKEKLWSDLCEVLQTRLAHEADATAREELRFRLGQALERELDDAIGAIGQYRDVLASIPSHAGARAALEGLLRNDSYRDAAAEVLEPFYRAHEEWDALVAALELRLAAEGDPARRHELGAEVAILHEQGRRDLGAAFAAWARVLGEDAADRRAQAELERLAGARSAFDELAKLYEERLDGTFDSELGRQLALKLAQIYEEALGDTEQAIGRYRKALEYPGDEAGPLAALDRLLEAKAAWAELAEVLEREANAATAGSQQADFLFRLGMVRERELGELDGALGAYRDVLEREPGHAEARAALERMLSHDAFRAQALDILEPLYESAGDFASLVRLGEVRLGLLGSPADRARLLEHLAEVWEGNLRDAGRALEAYGRALAEDAGTASLADHVERLARNVGRIDEAVRRFEAVVEAGQPPDTSRDLGLRAGRLLAEINDFDRAEARYRHVLEVDRENQEALEALDRIYRARGDDLKLAEVLERRAALELDPAKKKGRLAEVARLREGPLQDRPGAIAAWHAILAEDEGDADALLSLARLYEAAGDFAELAAVLETQARFADGKDAQAALKARQAEILAGPLDDADRAVDVYRELLDLRGDEVGILAAVEKLHERRGDWLAVQETLVRALAITADVAGKVQLYQRLARVAEEKRESADEAVGYLYQVLEVDAANVDALRELERLLGKAEKWYDLIDLYTRRADLAKTVGDATREVAALLLAARVWDERLQSPDSAVEILERIMERDPRNVGALSSLAKIYERQGQWEQCAEALKKAVALAPAGKEAAEIHFRLGRLQAEQLGDQAAALACYQQALAFDADHAEAQDAVIAAAREAGDFASVVRLLAHRAEVETDLTAKLGRLRELATLQMEKLADPAAALRTLEQARALRPDDPAVLEPLADMYYEAGRTGDAEPLYRDLIARLGKGRRVKEQARFFYRLGAVAEKNGDLPGALKHYDEAYRIDTAHTATLAALGRVYFDQQDWEKARRIYRSMLLQSLDAAAGVTKADVYLKLGLIHARLGETPKAKNMYERGLEVDPGHAGLKDALATLK
jgi:golgin subfamily B member 1